MTFRKKIREMVNKHIASVGYITDEFEQQIVNLVRDEVESLDYYDAIDNQGEDDYGRTHIRDMGESILVKEILQRLEARNE